MSDESPRFSTLYESRAYQARLAALEADDEIINDLQRLESEFDDVISGAEYLIGEGIGDMAQVVAGAKALKAVVMNRRQIMERGGV